MPSPSAAPWTVRDSLPHQDKVSAVCSPGQCPPPPEQERKELLIILVTTRGRHTQGFPPLGISDGTIRHRAGWALDCLTGFTYVYRKVSAQHYTQTHINNLRLIPEYEIQTNKGRMLEWEGIPDCHFFSLW